ncbi:MAG: aldolase [Sphingobium sp.]
MLDSECETIHATTVAIADRAVMIMGASGAGKSDLALRLIDRGAALLADDYTQVRARDGQLVASVPATIAGKMEVRGIGIITLPHIGNRPVALIVDLDAAVERMPAPDARRCVAGIEVPVMALRAQEASAPIKVELALKTMAR